MFAPSVRKEYLKRAQLANAAVLAAYKTLEQAKKKYALELGAYKSARIPYEAALKTFGEQKYQLIAEGKLAAQGNDMAQITAILNLGKKVMLVGSEFGVEIDTVNRLGSALHKAVEAEKQAWAALHKYLDDKKAVKEKEDPAAYKKWKKELRADLFK